jgi:hypothetical protein
MRFPSSSKAPRVPTAEHEVLLCCVTHFTDLGARYYTGAIIYNAHIGKRTEVNLYIYLPMLYSKIKNFTER